jgi:hypothetical protein
MTTKVALTRRVPQDIVLGAALQLGTATALLAAWIDKAGALDASHLIAPLHTLREAEAELINIEWTRRAT